MWLDAAAGLGQELHGFAFDRAFDFRRGPALAFVRCGVGLQIRNELSKVLHRQRIEEALGHRAHLRHGALLDLAGRDRLLQTTGHRDAHGVWRVFLHHATGHTSVLQLEEVKLVVLADHRVGIEHVVEQVVEVATIRAREVRPHLLPFAKHRVTLAADGAEQDFAFGLVRRCEIALREQSAELLLLLVEVGLRRIEIAEGAFQQGGHIGVVQRRELPCKEGREHRARNRLCLHSGE